MRKPDGLTLDAMRAAAFDALCPAEHESLALDVDHVQNVVSIRIHNSAGCVYAYASTMVNPTMPDYRGLHDAVANCVMMIARQRYFECFNRSN